MTIVDPRTVKFSRKKGGKPVSEGVDEIASDGKSLTFSWTNTAPDGTTSSGKGWQKRMAAAPAGAHALTGSWMTTGYDNVSDSATTVTYRVDGDTLHMTSPLGESYAAKFGGKPVAVAGDSGGTMVKVRKLGANSFAEENWRGGKLVGVSTVTIQRDGSMKAVYENKLRGSKMTYKAMKQ